MLIWNLNRGNILLIGNVGKKTCGGKKFKSQCALIILLKGDYDPKVDNKIPYVNWWTVDYKSHTKKCLS